MKQSLRFKLSVTLLATVLTTLLVTVLASNLFLEQYYSYGKRNTLVSAFHQINTIYQNTPVTDNNVAAVPGWEPFGSDSINSLKSIVNGELAMIWGLYFQRWATPAHRTAHRKVLIFIKIMSDRRTGSLSGQTVKIIPSSRFMSAGWILPISI